MSVGVVFVSSEALSRRPYSGGPTESRPALQRQDTSFETGHVERSGKQFQIAVTDFLPSVFQVRNETPSGKQQDRRGTTYGAASRNRQSSGSTLMIEAPWSLPVQNVTGVVELSTKTLRMFVDLGRR